MRSCTECGGVIPRSSHPLTTVCSDSCKKARRDRQSRESYHKYKEKRLAVSKQYGERWRKENPKYNAKWRLENPEKVTEYIRKRTYGWQIERPELTSRVEKILERCSPERARRLCEKILESKSEKWRRFRSSYSGDDLLGAHSGF